MRRLRLGDSSFESLDHADFKNTFGKSWQPRVGAPEHFEK